MNTILTDMAGSYIEHSDVITAFTSIVYHQLKDSTCKVYPDNVQYKWIVNGEEKTVTPDATINCRVHAKKGISFFDIPRFVMEVLSDSTSKYPHCTKYLCNGEFSAIIFFLPTCITPVKWIYYK